MSVAIRQVDARISNEELTKNHLEHMIDKARLKGGQHTLLHYERNF